MYELRSKSFRPFLVLRNFAKRNVCGVTDATKNPNDSDVVREISSSDTRALVSLIRAHLVDAKHSTNSSDTQHSNACSCGGRLDGVCPSHAVFSAAPRP